MPEQLARDLISYCVRESPPGHRSEELLEVIASTVFQVPVREVSLLEMGRGHTRRARIVVAAEDAAEFEALFPSARRLEASSDRLAAFSLDTCEPS